MGSPEQAGNRGDATERRLAASVRTSLFTAKSPTNLGSGSGLKPIPVEVIDPL
jgi:hypothetical protein